MSQENTPIKPVYVTPRPGQDGMTLLHYAAYCNDPDAVLNQLMSGIPVDVRDDNGWTPLHWSVDMAQAWGDPERVVSILLDHGASPNSADLSGLTVFMMACGRNNENILRQLIKAGADVHARTTTTPLHVAAACNFHEGIAILLAHGADPTLTNHWGQTPEQVADGFDETIAVLRAARPAR